MITTLDRLPQNIDIIICFGQQLNDDGSLDWVLQERVKLAVAAKRKYPNAVLLFTGGKKFTDERTLISTEANAMSEYMRIDLGIKDISPILEEEGNASLMQMIKIKKEHLISKKYKNIIAVSDEIHIKRVNVEFGSTLGPNFNLYCIGSAVNISGHYRMAIEKNEEGKRNYFITEMSPQFTSGDHEWLWQYHIKYQKAQLEYLKAGGDPSVTISLKDYRSVSNLKS